MMGFQILPLYFSVKHLHLKSLYRSLHPILFGTVLYSPGCPQTHCAAEDDRIPDPPASVCQVLGLQVFPAIASVLEYFILHAGSQKRKEGSLCAPNLTSFT